MKEMSQRMLGKVTAFYASTGMRPKYIYLGRSEKVRTGGSLLRFENYDIIYVEKDDHMGCGV
jgi:hypothetical protein